MSRTWSGRIAQETRIRVGFASPQEVADRLGVHLATVYAWEAGREPQMRHAVALADLYGISLDSLFVHDENGATADDGRGGNDDGARRDSQPEVAAAGAERE